MYRGGAPERRAARCGKSDSYRKERNMRYKIDGGQLPVVICRLDAGESMITEKGAMAWMTPNMHMETQGTGGLGKSLGRMLSGDTIFQNRYTAQGGEGEIAFASSFPGSILAIQITPDKPIIVQKRAFLACEPTVEMSVFFQRKFGAGLFGGEGFIMQKLTGNGTAFIEIDGHAVEYDLKAGEEKILATGYLAMMEATCTMDIVSVAGLKNKLLGGEGFFNTIVKGPGRIIVQTMPASKLAVALGVGQST